MSRTSQNNNENSVKNPATCYLEWSGAKGNFSYWNGSESVTVDGLKFALIDTTKSVSGWDNKSNSRIYSNAVKSVNDNFTVREAKTGSVLAEGTYSDIKSDRWSLTENIIALAEIDGVAGVVQVSLSKSALNAFIEFKTENKMKEIYKSVVSIKASEKQKTGSVEYYLPEFTLEEIDEEFATTADQADRELVKPYIEYVKERSQVQKPEEEAAA